MNTTWAGDQSRVPEKDVPSHGLRKQELGGLVLKEEHGIHGLLTINQERPRACSNNLSFLAIPPSKKSSSKEG
ncbi:hypothetical protein Tco_0033913 [Tanacetum coccineum]